MKKKIILCSVCTLLVSLIIIVFLKTKVHNEVSKETQSAKEEQEMDTNSLIDSENLELTSTKQTGSNEMNNSHNESDKINNYSNTDIVAYINDEPVYYGEVVFIQSMNKMYYNKFINANESDQDIMNFLKEKSEASLEQNIKLIAQQRAIIKEAVKQNYDFTEEEIKVNQNNEKEELTLKSGTETQQQEMKKNYDKMYDILNLSEDDCNKTYNYTRIEGTIGSAYLISKYITQYLQDHVIESDNEYTKVCLAYYDSLTEQMDIKYTN